MINEKSFEVMCMFYECLNKISPEYFWFKNKSGILTRSAIKHILKS